MKKFFSLLGIISLLSFTFFYTEKTVNVVKEFDDIMIQIKALNKETKKEPIDAFINGNTIIPGLSGMEIDINKSYSKMKRYGSFNNNLIVYKKTIPKVSINDNFDKFIISGNSSKMLISIILLIEDDTNIKNILDKIKNNKVNFFISNNWFNNNKNLIIELINKGHNFGTTKLDDEINIFVTKIANQKNFYCYTETENIDLLKKCSLNKNYTIIPNIKLEDSYLKKIKENLKNGSIIALKTNKTLEKELDLIIKYINSKGYKIVSLNELLEE